MGVDRGGGNPQASVAHPVTRACRSRFGHGLLLRRRPRRADTMDHPAQPRPRRCRGARRRRDRFHRQRHGIGRDVGFRWRRCRRSGRARAWHRTLGDLRRRWCGHLGCAVRRRGCGRVRGRGRSARRGGFSQSGCARWRVGRRWFRDGRRLGGRPGLARRRFAGVGFDRQCPGRRLGRRHGLRAAPAARAPASTGTAGVAEPVRRRVPGAGAGWGRGTGARTFTGARP